MSQGALYPNLSQKVQKEVSQMANHNSPHVILQGGLSVNLNHLKREMLSLPDGIGWAPVITGRVFASWHLPAPPAPTPGEFILSPPS